MLKSLTLLLLSWQSRYSKLALSPPTSGLVVSISTHMKTHRWFSRNRLVPHLRIASVVTLMSAAAAMAFVAVKPSGPALASSQDRLRTISKFRGDRDEL